MPITVTPATITIFGVVDDANTTLQLQNNAVDLAVSADSDLVSMAWNGATAVYVREFLRLEETGTGSDSGTITLRPNAASLTGSPANLATALKDGVDELVTFDVEDEDDGLVQRTVTIQFRALRTTDFILTGAGATATLEPAYHSTPIAPTNYHTNVAAMALTYTTPDVTAIDPVTGAMTVDPAITDAAMVTAPINRDLHITGAGVDSHLHLDIHIATDVIALLDRSGSMNGVVDVGLTRWGSAHQVTEAFSFMFQQMVVEANSPSSGSVAEQHKIDFGYFYNSGGVQVDFAGEAVTPAGDLLDAQDGTAPPAATPQGGTPIVAAIEQAAARFTTDVWRRRHIVLLTDGIHNVGTPTLATVAGYSAGDADSWGVPQAGSGTANAPGDGVTIHTVSYSELGETEEVNLANLASGYGGQHHVSATDADPLSVAGLFERFFDILSAIIPIERQATTSTVGTTFNVEDYLDKMMVIARRADPGDVIELEDDVTNGPVGPQTYGPNTGNGPRTTAGGNADYLWLKMDHPRFDAQPGTAGWQITNGPGTPAAVLFDLALTMNSGATRAQPGEPITVWAELTHLGKPLAGAEVVAGVSRPSESLGELLTGYTQKGKLNRASRKVLAQLANQTSIKAFDVRTHAAGWRAPVDLKSVQRLLLNLVEEERNLPFQHLGSSLKFTEVKPGRYEATVPGELTEIEGSYGLTLRARGTTTVGAQFARDRRVTTVVAPTPDQGMSEVSVAQVAVAGGQVTYQATVFPKTKTKKPLGPGLGHSVAFRYLDEKRQASAPAILTVDNLDGTYSAQITAKEGEPFPPIGFGFVSDRGNEGGLRIAEPQKNVRSVKVTLNKIQILDDKDGCLTGDGELSFDAVVAPNGNPNRAVRTRLPETGHFKLGDHQVANIEQVLFEGYLENDARLSVTIGGKEFDWFRLFDKSEPLARYHRQFDVERGVRKFTPVDERSDPECLSDWKLWYTIEAD